MDIENLKSTWRMMGENICNLEAENRRMAARLAAGKATTSKERLAKTARRGILCAVLLPLLAPTLTIVLDLPVWLSIVYGFFGVVMGLVNIWFYNKIMDSDYMSLPLVSALAEAYKIKIYLRNIRILGITLGLIIIISMFIQFLGRDEIAISLGMATGLAIGIIIGYKKWAEQSRLSRDIIRQLRAALKESSKDETITK